MKVLIFTISLAISFPLIPILSYSQESGLKDKLVRIVLKPYEGGLDSYLEAEEKDETERREAFFSLFLNADIEIYNDIPNRIDRGASLSVQQYCQISKSFGQGKKVVVELNYDDIFLCTSDDTTLFVKKTFIIDTSKTQSFLKIKIRYFPKANEDKFKILSMEKVKKPDDKDNDFVPNECDLCPSDLGSIDFRGCPDKDGDGIIDLNDKCPDISGTFPCQGCPDKDKDGVTDSDDDCPETPGLPLYSGCPYKIEEDTDNDGIPNIKDKCPTVAGSAANSGCPDSDVKLDSDRDGLIDEKDKCPNVAGIPEYSGCPYPPTNSKLDSDGDGISDDMDNCPNEYSRSSDGCPRFQFQEPENEKPVKIGIGLSSGFVASSLKNSDSDIDNVGGLGFSPYLFTTIQLSEESRLQFEVSYSKKSFVFSNHGDDSEFGFSDTYYYNTTEAKMSFHDARIYAKANINSLYFGGFFGKTVKATRNGNIEYVSSFEDVYDDNYEYDFFDEVEYPVVNGEKPISDFVYGISIGYEKIFTSGLLLGLGFDYNLSNYFNKNYSVGWFERGDNIDFYPSTELNLKLHYLYLTLGYRFGNTNY